MMAKADLQRDIRALMERSDAVSSLSSLMEEVCGLLKGHADALRSIDSRYRLETSDTGYVCAFALEKGAYRPLAADEAADVTLLGKETDLLRIFRGELSPMAALLSGRVKIRGKKAALMQFAEFF